MKPRTPNRENGNANLSRAKQKKDDEFYTDYSDIDRELCHYKDQLAGKVVYLPCDSRASQFYSWFERHFKELKLKRLIMTHYVPEGWGKPSRYDLTPGVRGRLILRRSPMKGDGDFRSEECRRIAEEADVIITNPPFSLLRDFFKFLRESEKKFLVIIPLHAVYSQVAFPFLYGDHAWLGVTQPKFFKTPDGGVKKFGNTCWFTNMENPRRQQPLKLTKVYRGHEADYPTYDNYNAIEVSRTCDIPADYDGLMGVPLSFLHKHDPRQFEILGQAHGRAEYELCAQPVKKYENAVECVSGKVVPPTCSINTGAVFAVDQVPEGRHYYMVPGQEKPLVMPYSRLLIRRRADG